MEIKIDKQKTQKYYRSDDSLPCECEICKYYIENIKSLCPEINEYFERIDVDILRPFELVWIDIDGKIQYLSCQYVVYGLCSDDFSDTVGDLTVDYCICHTDTQITDKHFVLEFGPVEMNSNDKLK